MGMKTTSLISRRLAEVHELVTDLLVALGAPVDQVHLVDADDQVGNAQQAWPGRRDGETARGCPLRASTRTRARWARRRPGHHVAGVLHVAGGVGDDELAFGRGEVAVGDVDGDALLALRPQPVGQQGQVDRVVAPVQAGAADGLQLVLEDGLRVEEQPADQGGLAVVDRSGGGQAEQLAHQKYPSRLRSSMPASEIRSSARVAPRSVSRVTDTSSMMRSMVSAADSIAPRAVGVADRAEADDG